MNIMRRKLGKNSGFTLVEMLIVVAIIAILIAVSIPLVTESLEKARDATDIANERAAKAEAAMVYMEAVNDPKTGTNVYGNLKNALIYDSRYVAPDGVTGDGLFYNAKTGKLSTTDNIIAADRYGKCTGAAQCTRSAWLSDGHEGFNSGLNDTHVGKVIKIRYCLEHEVYFMEWV